MTHRTHGRVSRNLIETVNAINKAPGLAFSDVLDSGQIQQLIEELGIAFGKGASLCPPTSAPPVSASTGADGATVDIASSKVLGAVVA